MEKKAADRAAKGYVGSYPENRMVVESGKGSNTMSKRPHAVGRPAQVKGEIGVLEKQETAVLTETRVAAVQALPEEQKTPKSGFHKRVEERIRGRQDGDAMGNGSPRRSPGEEE